ncbi:MAG: hypothetical protein LBT92_00915 [Rickettsiales bacterium]|jgi:hypothetical protein|nr:hypothetical protein [Rickettsiales bacterium]
MYKTTFTNTAFSRGEISPHLLARGDFESYRSCAMKLRNFRVLPVGSIRRRPGTVFVAELPGEARLIPFAYSQSDSFLLAFTSGRILVYSSSGRNVGELSSPFMPEHFARICYAQKGGELYLSHPDVPPAVISYDPIGGSWSVSGWNFSTMPFSEFPEFSGISVKPSGTGGSISLSSGADFFTGDMVGIAFRINGGEVRVSSVSSPAVASAEVLRALDSAAACDDFTEQAFSARRGWPSSITFHQDRLVIGGSAGIPNRLWFSKTGDYLNFDLGAGLDDEAIEFNMLSDRVNDIAAVFAGRHLQVFTGDSEWMVSGSPLTPTSVMIREQTKIGSMTSRLIKPVLVEGSTIFVARNGREIREFYYGEIEGGYRSDDLVALSSHLMQGPVEQEYDASGRMLYVVQGDGSMAVLSLNKGMDINAWSHYETAGEFKSIACVGGSVYVAVRRGGRWMVEYFSDDVGSDSSRVENFGVPSSVMPGLSHLEGGDVVAVADDYVFAGRVEGGVFEVSRPARNIRVGLPFSHCYCPLPAFVGRSRPPRASRLLELVVRVIDTPLVEIDVGRGPRAFTGARFGGPGILDSPLAYFTGDVRAHASGLVRGFDVPMFKIEGSLPLPVHILSITQTVECVR